MEGPEAVRCRACGDPLPDRARSCPTCGTAVAAGVESEPSATWPSGPLAEASASPHPGGRDEDLSPLPPPPPMGSTLEPLGDPVEDDDEYNPPSMVMGGGTLWPGATPPASASSPPATAPPPYSQPGSSVFGSPP